MEEGLFTTSTWSVSATTSISSATTGSSCLQDNFFKALACTQENSLKYTVDPCLVKAQETRNKYFYLNIFIPVYDKFQ